MLSQPWFPLFHAGLTGIFASWCFFLSFAFATPATQPNQLPPSTRPVQPIARPTVVQPTARPLPTHIVSPTTVRPHSVPSVSSTPSSQHASESLIRSSDRTDRYDMFFRHKKVGEFSRTEKHLKNGFIEVNNESNMNIKMLFTTVKAINRSTCLYDQRGELVQFTIKSEVRGKITTYTGKRDQRGLTVVQTEGKKKQEGFFPADSFQGTSLDYRFPPAHAGISILRQYLVIPRMQMVEQSLTYREATPRKVFGKTQPVYEITIKNQRGHGTVLVTQDGRMIASRMLGRLGVVEIRWNGSK